MLLIFVEGVLLLPNVYGEGEGRLVNGKDYYDTLDCCYDEVGCDFPWL